MAPPLPCSYITGIGLHTCMGQGDHAEALRLPPRELDRIPRTLFGEDVLLPYRFLDGFRSGPDSFDAAQERMQSVICRVVDQALSSAGLRPDEIRKMPLLIGSSSFDVAISEQLYRKELAENPDEALPLRLSRMGVISLTIREHLGITGEDMSFNTACTSSASAALYAHYLLGAGEADHALVVGVELFNEISAQGFHGLSLMAEEVMRPFDDRRNGLNLGEACGAVVLSRAPRATGRWVLRGGASCFDRHSISAANPDGSSVWEVMQKTLEQCGRQPQDIEMVKTHGTASLLNDEAESAGMKKLFGSVPLLCALKPYVGHTLGACGIVELAMMIQAAQAGLLPANPGIAPSGELGVALQQEPTAYQGGDLVLNYFGFGGNNCTLIVGCNGKGAA